MSATTAPPATPTAPVEEVRAPRRTARLLVLVLLTCLAGAAGAWWFFGQPESTTPTDGEIVALEPLTTAIGGGAAMHARVGIAVVLTDGTSSDAITPRLALLEDAVTAELAELSSEDLRSPESTQALRRDLSAHARDIWGTDRVRRVLLTEVMLD